MEGERKGFAGREGVVVSGAEPGVGLSVSGTGSVKDLRETLSWAQGTARVGRATGE